MQTLVDKQRIPVPATSMVGREAELARVLDQIRQPDVRLVTLLGPGGVGKTRLALQVGHEAVHEFEDVRFVPMVSIMTGDEILQAIAHVIGSTHHNATANPDEVIKAIGERRLLLILDNAEQVAHDLVFLADLINACPHVTLLVTSRVPVRLSAERIIPIDPLPTMTDEPDIIAPATALFIERAQAVRPDIDLSAESVAAIDAICRRVDGLPLAIELAAARTRFLPPSTLQERLDQRLAMLVGGPRDAPERHRTLRATLEWSYELLTPEERILFRRLAVCINGAPYDAIDPICNAPGDLDGRVEELLGNLVDHSLVRIDDRPETGPRVRMLQIVREFASEVLAESEELESIERAHAMWYSRLVIDTPNWTWGTGRQELRLWTMRYLPDFATFSVVLKRLMLWDDPITVVEMVGPLISFWNEIGQFREAYKWCQCVLPSAPLASPEAQAELYFKAAMLDQVTGDHQTSLTYGQRALDLFTELGHTRHIANAQNLIGNLYWKMGDPDKGKRYQELAISTTKTSNDPLGAAMFKSQLADRLIEHGNYDEAEQLIDSAEPVILRERPDAASLLSTSRTMMYLITGRLDECGDALERALAFHEPPPHRRPDILVQLLMTAAELSIRRDQINEGVQLLGASHALGDAIGLPISSDFQEDIDRIHAMLESHMDATKVRHLEMTGAGFSIPEAIDLALDVARIRSASKATEEPDDDLTARERDVLRLLVAGKSNAAIAAELSISQRTVTTHLTHLYAKLDVSSRTEAISAATRRGLVPPT